ncbi:MAG: hypothetical protein QG596_1360 [Actinomycetota bacterium]|nr:hypothetical protein [Actinomycetota bacterium]
MEHRAIGSAEGHGNWEALAALVFGVLATCFVVVAALSYFLESSFLGDSGAWLVLPSIGIFFGLTAVSLGSPWMDVRRGATDRRLLEAKLATILGGLAAFAVLAAIGVLIVLILQALAEFTTGFPGAGDGGGFD